MFIILFVDCRSFCHLLQKFKFDLRYPRPGNLPVPIFNFQRASLCILYNLQIHFLHLIMYNRCSYHRIVIILGGFLLWYNYCKCAVSCFWNCLKVLATAFTYCTLPHVGHVALCKTCIIFKNKSVKGTFQGCETTHSVIA